MIVRPQHTGCAVFLSGMAQYYPRYPRLTTQFSLFYRCYFHAALVHALGIKFTLAPFSILGVAIAIFLVFAIMPVTPVTLKRENFGAVDDCLAVVTARGKNDIAGLASVREFARLQIAFAHCLRMNYANNHRRKYWLNISRRKIFASTGFELSS